MRLVYWTNDIPSAHTARPVRCRTAPRVLSIHDRRAHRHGCQLQRALVFSRRDRGGNDHRGERSIRALDRHQFLPTEILDARREKPAPACEATASIRRGLAPRAYGQRRGVLDVSRRRARWFHSRGDTNDGRSECGRFFASRFIFTATPVRQATSAARRSRASPAMPARSSAGRHSV